MNIETQILQNVSTLKRLKEEVDKATKNKRDNPQVWQKAVWDFHEKYDALAFPGGLKEGLAKLKEKNSGLVDMALHYLHVDPYFFRSGYIKEQLIHLLKKVTLHDKQKKFAQEIVLHAVRYNTRREYSAYCTWARYLNDAKFEETLQRLVVDEKNTATQKRAQKMIRIIKN